MDERLNKSNRLPGSEKLTRPEEIGQLSKYLKSIREGYDENIRLEDQLVGVAGRTTGRIPVIDSLGKKIIKTPESQTEDIDLSQKILNIETKGGEPIELYDSVLELPGNENSPSNSKLNEKLVKGPDNQGGEVSRLEKVVKKIKDVRDQKLGNKRIDLLDEKYITLEDKRLDLQAIVDASLKNKRVNLEGETKDPKLGDKKLGIKDDRDLELGDKRLDLKDEHELKLPDKTLKIEEQREPKLEEKRLDIQDARIESLENKRVDISVEKESKLKNTRINLKDERELKLGDKKLGIKDDRDLEELGNKRLDLNDDEVIEVLELPDPRIDLEDPRKIEIEDEKVKLGGEIVNPNLENKRVNISDDRELGLGDKRLDLGDTQEVSLGDKRLDLEDIQEVSLEDRRIDIKDENEVTLSDKLLGLTDERETDLPETRIDLQDDRKETSLPEEKLELTDDRETTLEDKVSNLQDTRKLELEKERKDIIDERDTTLSEKILSLLDDHKIELPDKRIDLEDRQGNELEDEKLDLPENENGIPIELYDSIIEIPSDQEEPSLSEKQIGLLDNKNLEVPDITSDLKTIKEYTAKLSDSELYEFAMEIANQGDYASGEYDAWVEKVSGIMSSYLSNSVFTPKRAIEFRELFNKTLETGYLGSQVALRAPIDTSSNTTWAKAEELVGEQITGTTRRDALDEMIVKLVNYKKSGLPRVPGPDGEGLSGFDIESAAEEALYNVAGVVSGDIARTISGGSDHSNPMNKPISQNGMAFPGGLGDTFYQAANNRTNFNTCDFVGDTIGNTFYARYWKAKSFRTTLEELCPIMGKSPVSLFELKSILKASPYLTTPGKFMTDTKGSYNTFSLDTNMYWEITIEPFCEKTGTCNNGGLSFLPSIREINFLNKKLHGVSTNYGYWAPINAFELQKSKLVTKNLSLYEGEISYPTGIDFTNDLRLTFVDDAWKSWKRYFERCSEVAVYNSKAWSKEHYSKKIKDFEELTRIDKNYFCISPYKNVTFNIKIYILNPQLNLLNKFDLLCVLKDYSEEYVGEIDSGGTDLNVTFSIVGENPEIDISEDLKKDVKNKMLQNLGKEALLQAQKRISGALNFSVGLL